MNYEIFGIAYKSSYGTFERKINMDEMKMNVTEDISGRINFRLPIDQNAVIVLQLVHGKEEKHWGYHFLNPSWYEFFIQDKTFFPLPEERFPNSEKEKVNEYFYELIRQMKTHPNYRLKVIHLLNDELREIWDTI